MRNSLKLAAVLVAVTATSASAQGRGRNVDGVPPGMRPPAGMCRVWINGVPPGQQSGVTDCASAQAQVRANSRVIYGSNTNRSNVLNRTYARRRQLTDGSWVLERFRRDANGNLTVVSSRQLNTNADGTWNNKRGDDNEANDDNNDNNNDHHDNDEMKGERKGDKHEWKKNGNGKHGNKGKHENDNENDNE